MLLFPDLVFALCVSVSVSLLFATASLILFRGKTTTSVSVLVAHVAERRTKHPHFAESDNGFSKTGIFGGFECAGRVFDESSVRPGWVYDVTEPEVRFVRDVLDEIHVRPERDEIVDEDDGKIFEVGDLVSEFPEEGMFSGVDLDKDVLGGKTSEFMIEQAKNEGSVGALEVVVLESEISKKWDAGGVEFEVHIVDEILERPKIRKFVTGLGKSWDNVEELEEVKVLGSQISKNIVSSGMEFDESPGKAKDSNFLIKLEKKKDTKSSENEEDGDEEEWIDDWEGIESTELEKRFGDAVLFFGSKGNAHQIMRLENEVKMQLYGLYKVAIEGPCRVQQPMAFKVSARAKWNAWRLLGDMSREVAMELYISLLSKSLPEWLGDDPKCVGRTGNK